MDVRNEARSTIDGSAQAGDPVDRSKDDGTKYRARTHFSSIFPVFFSQRPTVGDGLSFLKKSFFLALEWRHRRIVKRSFCIVAVASLHRHALFYVEN